MEEDCVDTQQVNNSNLSPSKKSYFSPIGKSNVRQSKESYVTPNKTKNESYVKMIENCVKMECAGCRKLIPTHLFFEHLMTNQNSCMGRESLNPNISAIFSKSNEKYSYN